MLIRLVAEGKKLVSSPPLLISFLCFHSAPLFCSSLISYLVILFQLLNSFLLFPSLPSLFLVSFILLSLLNLLCSFLLFPHFLFGSSLYSISSPLPNCFVLCPAFFFFFSRFLSSLCFISFSRSPSLLFPSTYLIVSSPLLSFPSLVSSHCFLSSCSLLSSPLISTYFLIFP